jgi:hypothetical protein
MVLRVIEEPDGDLHVWILLDAGQSGLLAPGNLYHTNPALLAEFLPQHCGGVPQQDAENNCADSGGFSSPAAPVEGSHVTVTGPWVYDTVHAWNEIHPVWLVGP